MPPIDTTHLCSHLQKKLFEEDGVYHPLWTALQDDPALTAVVRSRQLHIYRDGKKVLILAGKAVPKVIRDIIAHCDGLSTPQVSEKMSALRMALRYSMVGNYIDFGAISPEAMDEITRDSSRTMAMNTSLAKNSYLGLMKLNLLLSCILAAGLTLAASAQDLKPARDRQTKKYCNRKDPLQ